MDGLALPDEIWAVFSLGSHDLLTPLSADGTVVEEQVRVLHHPGSVTLLTSTETPNTILFGYWTPKNNTHWK